MAGRAHKKLLAQQLAPGPGEEEDESSSEEEEAPAAPFNPFSLLTDDEDEGTEEQDSDDEQSSSPEAAPPPRPAAAAAASGGRKRGGKGRKKGSGKRGGGEDSDEEAAADAKGKAAVDEEDLDAILQELNLQPSAAAAAAQQQQQGGGGAGGRPLLAVDMRQLKADEELRRMFGSRVVEEDEDEGGAGAYAGASRRVRRLAARGLLRRAALKPGAIINPRDTWPRFDGGFTMELQGTTPDGRQRFGYAYSQAYQAVQELYEECQATFDPNNIAALLQNHPYHLDALLTMHDLYRSMGEQAYAEEMLERALYDAV